MPSVVQASFRSECPDEDALADFVGGGLDESRRADLRAHFDACERCGDTLGLFIGAFDEGSGGSLSGDTRSGNHRAVTTFTGPFAGRYEIRECVGLGAGGTVYAAYDPELERVVALKVLRAVETKEDGSTQLDTQWTREAKAMAKVVHPNVVTVHDVGVADEHVFIATEYVEGGSLSAWLEVERPWPEVLAVFVEAGRGLAAIHDCGLVHRDFKPHNVMVGRDGRARVTDFGLARLLPDLDDLHEQQTAEAVLQSVDIAETIATRTRTGMLVGTPAYMSPEQWRGVAATARSDQFSFCVALYQGLWGTRPFAGKTSVELAERVCSGAVTPVPSTSRVPRWLERVVLRGLACDADRRFAAMDALLAALHEGPRRARRRWATVALAAGFAGVAGLGYAVASLSGQACNEDDARFSGIWDETVEWTLVQRLTDPAMSSEVVTTLDAWVEQWHQHSNAACRAAKVDLTLGEQQHALQLACLDRRAAELSAATGVLATADARRVTDVLATIGSPSRCADPEVLARIEPMWTDAAARVLAAEIAPRLARVESLRAAGDYDGSLQLALELVAVADENGDPALRAEALTQLGLTQSTLKQPAEATETLRAATWAAEASGHVEMAAVAWIEMVEVVGGQQELYDEAERAAERADAAVHRLGDPERAILLGSSRGLLTSMQGRYDEALVLQTDVLRAAEEHFGPRHRQVSGVHMNVAAVLSHLGRLDEALEHAERGVEIIESTVSATHPSLADYLNTVGALQLQLQRRDAARVTYARAIEIAESTVPPTHATLASLYSNLAHADVADKKYDEAIAGYTQALALYRQVHGAQHPDVALTLHNLAGAIDDAGDKHRAIEVYRDALQMRLATTGPDHPGTSNSLHNLGLLLFSTGDIDEGIELMEKARTIREGHNIDPYKRASTRFMLARAYEKRGDRATALAYAEEAALQLRSIAPRHADILSHIEDWLAKHK